MGRNGEIVRSYIKAIEAGAQGDDLGRFFHPDIEQTEYPNRLVPNGATRDRAALLLAAERGSKVTKAQGWDITRIIEQGDMVVAEFDWWAELTVAIGSLPAGGRMTGHFCTVVELEDGLIRKQRNYDCFDPTF